MKTHSTMRHATLEVPSRVGEGQAIPTRNGSRPHPHHQPDAIFNGTMPEPRIPRTATAGVPIEMAVVFEEPGTAEVVLVYSTRGLEWHKPEGHKGDGRKVFTVEVSEAG